MSFSERESINEKSGRLMMPSNWGIDSGEISFAMKSPTKSRREPEWFTML